MSFGNTNTRSDEYGLPQSAAQELRNYFTERGTLVVNILSSAGAGKTSLLESTARLWNDRNKMAVLAGDIATERDAQRLFHLTPVVQLTTDGPCHLEIPLILRGLEQLGDVKPQFLFIENVGNLVNPASFDLGEHLRVVALSTTQGDDKPGKYPGIFRSSQVMVITKTDLLPYVPFSVDAAVEDARRIQPQLDVLATSALDGTGIADWCAYLERTRRRILAQFPARSPIGN